MDIVSLIRLIALGAIWGSSFIFMRIGVPVFGPSLLIELRVLIAALMLAGVAVWLRQTTPARRHWRYFLFVGFFNTALPFLLFAYAAQVLPASLLAILNSTAPLFGAVIAALWLRTRITPTVTLGLLSGMAGVAVLVGAEMGAAGAGTWLAIAAGLVAPACYGLASTYAKVCQASVTPFANAHGSLWAASLLLLPLALVYPAHTAPQSGDWAAVAALGALCTGGAYLLYFRLVRDVGPTRALSVAFLIPVFGVLWGALFLHEPVGWNTLLGGALVLAGTALTNGLVRLPERAAVVP